MNQNALLLTVALLLTATPSIAAEKPWVPLFNGKTLQGWTPLAQGDVKAVDGEIQMLSTKANLWLLHEGRFDNFELTVEAKMPADAYNSGIGFRCVAPEKANGKGRARLQGYQCEIDRSKSGMVYAIGSGWVWPKSAAEKQAFNTAARDVFKNDQWNSFRIRCQGDHLQIWINGKAIADIRDGRLTSGRIALQHHGKGGLHRFRNIKIRDLN